MSRTVVSYDDITDSGPPPAKRQKKSGGGGGRGGWKKNSKGQGQHNQNQNQNSKPKEKAGKGEKGRELTHEEIWDDSALLDAWNAATAEYEVSRLFVLSLFRCADDEARLTMDRGRGGRIRMRMRRRGRVCCMSFNSFVLYTHTG